MDRPKKTFISVLLILVLTLSLAGCRSAGTAEPQPTEVPETAAQDLTYGNNGLTLTVPAEYADQVVVESTGDQFFYVTEKASREAAEKLRPDNTYGAGWLFGISRVSEAELHDLLCTDMSGREVFARSGDMYYLLNTPTDVRIEREGDITQSDMDQWSALYDWIRGAMLQTFMAENGLTECRYTNTALDMLLARIAWKGSTDYNLVSLDYGERRPQGTEGASFAEEILSAGLRYADGESAPDGEYYVLNDLANASRYDFFKGNGQLVREVHGEYETLYRTVNGADLTDILVRWNGALEAVETEPYDEAAYQAAVDAVLNEFRNLGSADLENFAETDHPELPWYTAIIANPVRNTLFYGFYDFDENGVPELLIAAGDATYQQPEAIYAFDGSKMVYLCKEQALGERCVVSFVDGEFIVVGSGGATSGILVVYTIGPDGYSTQIHSSTEYEYDFNGNPTLTSVQGSMTDEQFDAYMHDVGAFVPVEYTRFAP